MDDSPSSQEFIENAGPRARSRVVALLLALIPGWGHIYWSREVLGLSIFTVFAPCFFSLVYSYFLYVGPYRDHWVQASMTLLFLVYVGSWVELFLRTRPARVRAEEEMRADGLTGGLLLYVQGDLDGAARQFLRCLHLDPFDLEAQFRLGMVLARAGATREARRRLRRARKYDREGKWVWEIERELRRLRSGPNPDPDVDESSTKTELSTGSGAPAVASEETEGS